MKYAWTIVFSGLLSLIPFLTQAQSIEWPVDFADPETTLSDTFGPRVLSSSYDFHRGIDIPGTTSDEVLAVADGEIFRMYTEGEEGNPYSSTVMIVRHDFDTPYTFGGSDNTRFYAMYMHLSSFESGLQEGDQVVAGDVLGYIGDTGATFEHLHFELRVQTTRTLETQLDDDPSCSDCFDPHIHPFTFLDYPQTNTYTASLTRADQDIEVELRIPSEEMDFASITVQARDSGDSLIEEKTVDFQTREGIDATSQTAIDTATYDGVTLEPTDFSLSDEEYILGFTFADIFTGSVSCVDVFVEDVKGNSIDLGDFSENSVSCDYVEPVEEVPQEDVPEETPVDETPVDDTPSEETPIDNTPSEETPTDDTSTNTEEQTSTDISVVSVTGLKRGDLRILYSDDSTERLSVFGGRSLKRVKVQEIDGQHYIVLTPSGKKVALVHVENQEVLKRRTIERKRSFSQHAIRVRNFHNDSSQEFVVVSKKKAQVRVALFSVNVNTGAMKKKSVVQFRAKNVRVSKTRTKRKQVILRNRTGSVLKRIRVKQNDTLTST